MKSINLKNCLVMSHHILSFNILHNIKFPSKPLKKQTFLIYFPRGALSYVLYFLSKWTKIISWEHEKFWSSGKLPSFFQTNRRLLRSETQDIKFFFSDIRRINSVYSAKTLSLLIQRDGQSVRENLQQILYCERCFSF